jgi:Resolvase, N terminal domain
VDHGLTGTNRDRPGLRLALAACRAGDTLVVTKLDRLARSLPDARDILAELTARNVRLGLGGSVHDPNDSIGLPQPPSSGIRNRKIPRKNRAPGSLLGCHRRVLPLRTIDQDAS